MVWWAWLLIGALLLVAELTLVDLEFYLVLLGVSALAVGALELAGLGAPYWVQWLLFGGLSITALTVFRRRIYGRLRPPPERVIAEGVVGDRAVAAEAIAPGALGAVNLRGATWRARNDGGEEIPAGAGCRVIRSEGLTLSVSADS